jgi:hypothetical protein
LTHHYILTDPHGYITSVSEGLWEELGLSKRVTEEGNALRMRLKIDDLVEEHIRGDEETFELLQSVGIETRIKTQKIIDSINVENLN